MYLSTSTSSKCTRASSPVVCLETADRTLGGQVHDYANVLAVGHGFLAPGRRPERGARRGATLANSLEILGDAEPTQANYNQVLNTFNIASAIQSLQSDVTKLDGQLG